MAESKSIVLPESKAKSLVDIRPRKQNRNPTTSKRRTIVAVDTETDDGRIFLIADSDGNKLEHPNITIDSVLQFLMRYEGKWVFFHNLRYDAECILRLLPEQILKTYLVTKQLKFQYKDYTIHYIEKKALTIRKGNKSVSCFDIAQFYDNKSLVQAYKEAFKILPDEEYFKMKEERSKFDTRYFLRNKRKIRKYCIQDCILAKKIAENWVDIFFKVYGFYPRKWISAGNLAEKILINNKVNVPFFDDAPYAVQELAWACYYGGRFELIQRGYIGEAALYDINSAYPHSLTKIPDFNDGRWIKSKKIDPRAAAGFFKIQANIDPTSGIKIAPFPFRTKNNMIIYPVGDFVTYVTLEELKMVLGDDRICCIILDSWQFIPNEGCKYPFKQFIEEQYDKRIKLKLAKNPLERAIKVELNSIYGKTAQRVNGRMGNLFSPIIAASIAGYARAQLYKFVKEHDLENDVVAFATDSVATRKKIGNLHSEELGKWKLEKQGDDAYFLSNGFYRFEGIWKNRGVGYDYEKKVQVEYQATKEGDNGQLYISLRTTRTTHIKTAIRYNRLGKVGKIEEYEKHINLNSDRKRLWAEELQSINDNLCVKSAPLSINEVADIVAEKQIVWTDEKEETYTPESDL